LDDAAAGRTTSPAVADGPGLEPAGLETVLLEFLPRPLVGGFQLVRSGQPRPDHVRQVFQVGQQLTVLFDFLEELAVCTAIGARRRWWALRHDQRRSQQ